jgi:hypothetical protein
MKNAFKPQANQQLSIAGLVALDKNAVLALSTNALATGREAANEAADDTKAQITEHLDAAEVAIKKAQELMGGGAQKPAAAAKRPQANETPASLAQTLETALIELGAAGDLLQPVVVAALSPVWRKALARM